MSRAKPTIPPTYATLDERSTWNLHGADTVPAQGENFIGLCGLKSKMQRSVASRVVVSGCASGVRAFESCLGDFLRLVALSSTLLSPDLLSSGLPQSSPSLWGTPRLSLLRESSTTVGQVHRGDSDPLSPLFFRRRGFTHSQSICRLSHRPFLSSDPASLPRRVLSGLPEP